MGITELFAEQASHLSDSDIQVFDELLTRLTIQIEVTARAIMAVRLAPIRNAPRGVIRRLAFDDAIEVAAPVLSKSEQLTDEDLVENARCKSQDHLLAIAGRAILCDAVTDVLAERGDRRVLLNTARNQGARISNKGFSILVQRSDDDVELAVSIGTRQEMPRYLFRQLVGMASETVREKLQASHPEAFDDIGDIVAEAAEQVGATAADRPTRRETTKQKYETPRTENIDKSLAANDLSGVASTVAALCDMPVEFADQAIRQRGVETFLVLARAAGLSVPTLRAILRLRGNGHMPINEIEKFVMAYRRLNIETAEEILHFYRTRTKQS